MGNPAASANSGAPQRRSRPAAWDVVLTVLGMLFGAVSLTYPFGRDQGLYFYVAREWVLRGAIPYRDVLDHKTPGIYLVHALAVAVFGERAWGIRVLDLGCILALGLFAGALATPVGRRPFPGVRGAAVLSASVMYFGFFDFWNTAQSEVWYGTFGIAAVWAATRVDSERRAAVATGVFCAAAMIVKPPSVWFVMIAVGVLTLRARTGGSLWTKRGLTLAGLFAAGGFAVAAPIFGYFAAHHALADLVDIVGGANSYYVRHEGNLRSVAQLADVTWFHFRYFNPFSTVLVAIALVGIVVGTRLKDAELRRRHVVAALLCAAGYAAVAMQGKFYLLHWGAVLGPVTVLLATAAVDARQLAEARKRPSLGIPAFALAVALLYGSSGAAFDMWLGGNRAAVDWLGGKTSREQFASRFAFSDSYFWYGDSEWVGLWLRDHSSPDDFVAVRGFQPEIYAVAHRRYSGRFFWTTFLVSPSRAYKREQWLEEERKDFEAHPPRYVVTLEYIHEGLDSTEHYLPLGYAVCARRNEFTILERTAK